jgi:shikimate kinase
MGSGKTTIGKSLARQLHKKFVDVDTVIEKEQNSSVTEIFDEKGEEHFRQLEQKCIDDITKKTGQVIATGGGLPIYSDIAEKSLIINIDADFEVILERLPAKEREKRPLLQDESRAKALFEQRIDTYRELADFSVDANQKVSTFIHVIFDYILDKRVL